MRRGTVRIAALVALSMVAGAEPTLADRPEPAVTVFPLTGKAGLADSGLPTRLTEVVVAEVMRRDMRAVRAGASFADTVLLIGCNPRAAACHAALLRRIDSRQAVFGSVAPAAGQSGRIAVTLTRIRRGRPAVKRTMVLAAESADQAAADLVSTIGEVLGPIPETAQGTPTAAVQTDAVREPIEQEPSAESPVRAPPAGVAQTDSRAAPKPTRSVAAAPNDDRTSPGFGVRMNTPSWALVGGGAALTGAGVLMWILADRKQSEIADAPTATQSDLERLVDLENSARNRADAGNVLFAAGMAVAASGLILAFLNDRGAPASPALSVTPMPVAAGIGVAVTMPWSR